MLHALLLSPDDQAVSAISGVLEEMSVSCERPLDGVTAAQKLNSQSFDLVLVDCENLPAAKLIFDVCRRGKTSNNSVPIAIVDGRAGLPTAFRLGAELILTKPVAKDQARSTIRTAISRVRKEVSTNEAPAENASEAVPQERAMAAAAGASPQLTSFADVNPSFNPGFARGTVPPSYLTAALTASGLTTMTQSTPEEISKPGTSKSNSKPATSSVSSSGSCAVETDSTTVKALRPLDPAEDLVLAEIDRAESSGPEAEESKLAPPQPETSTAKKASAKSSARMPSYLDGRRKTRGPLIALLMLTVAGAVFYAVWRYQPGFRDVAGPRVYRQPDSADKAVPSAQAQSSGEPSAQTTPAKTSLAAPTPAAAAPAESASSNPASSAAGIPAPAASAPAAPTAGAAVLPPAAVSASAIPPVANGRAIVKSVQSKSLESKKQTSPAPSSSSSSHVSQSAAPSSGTALPGEMTAIILSSKGAEKRLTHSVPPKYPADAGSQGAQGRIVLKTMVGSNGQVEGVRLVDGNAILATAAMQAVRQWRYRPYLRDGKALPFQTVVILDSRRPDGSGPQ